MPRIEITGIPGQLPKVVDSDHVVIMFADGSPDGVSTKVGSHTYASEEFVEALIANRMLEEIREQYRLRQEQPKSFDELLARIAAAFGIGHEDKPEVSRVCKCESCSSEKSSTGDPHSISHH